WWSSTRAAASAALPAAVWPAPPTPRTSPATPAPAFPGQTPRAPGDGAAYTPPQSQGRYTGVPPKRRGRLRISLTSSSFPSHLMYLRFVRRNYALNCHSCDGKMLKNFLTSYDIQCI